VTSQCRAGASTLFWSAARIAASVTTKVTEPSLVAMRAPAGMLIRALPSVRVKVRVVAAAAGGRIWAPTRFSRLTYSFSGTRLSRYSMVSVR
jgi:hypothetical protein